MKRLLISATGSNCGKTTVSCALLSAFKARGCACTAFKCGPDYIDPMFHRAVTGVAAYNLDPFFLDEKGLVRQLARYAGDLSLIEGAMGYYDGIATTDRASAYTVARATRTPVVLVVRTEGMGASLAAVLAGFKQHRPDSRIEGVIFNGAAQSRYPDLQVLAAEAGLTAYGYLPRQEGWELPARQLGLLTPAEIEDVADRLQSLGDQAEASLDLDGLLALAATAPDLALPEPAAAAALPGPAAAAAGGRLRLGIARDAAFSFYYQENLELFRELGCDLVFFSPLTDQSLPAGVAGLYLGGGYPELFARELSDNSCLRASISAAIQAGLPTIAEGGGFMYLHEHMAGLPQCGVIPGGVTASDRLQHFGYISLQAREDNLLSKAGELIRAREFHYWQSDNPGAGFTAKKAGRDLTYDTIHATASLYAGFPQLYLPANPDFAHSFVAKMRDYAGGGPAAGSPGGWQKDE